MNWLLIYTFIGAVVSVLSWMYFTSNWCKRNVGEGDIAVYLPLCVVVWPICVISACYEFYNYLKIKWDF